MNKIRHCCYMVGEDLGITGIKAIKDFPEKEGEVAQILFLAGLMSRLKDEDKGKHQMRLKYIKSLFSLN